MTRALDFWSQLRHHVAHPFDKLVILVELGIDPLVYGALRQYWRREGFKVSVV